MKKIISIGMVAVALFLVIYTFQDYRISVEYNRSIGSYWSLAEKVSTIEAKSENLDKFVAAYSASYTAQNDAIFFPTLDDSRDANLAAIKTLQTRLHEIKTMDVSSFQYQQAIQQITAQEQGEAQKTLDVLSGCWTLANHPFYWRWIQRLIITSCAIYFVVWFIIMAVAD